jgi:hypothetical protein
VKLGSRHRRHFRPPPSFLSATTRLNAQPGTPSPTRNHRWSKRIKRCLAVNLHAWRSPVICIQYHHSRITLIRQDHPRESRARHNRSFLLSQSSNSMDLSFSFPRRLHPASIAGYRYTDLLCSLMSLNMSTRLVDTYWTGCQNTVLARIIIL